MVPQRCGSYAANDKTDKRGSTLALGLDGNDVEARFELRQVEHVPVHPENDAARTTARQAELGLEPSLVYKESRQEPFFLPI